MSPVRVTSRDEYLLLAKVAEEAERYEDLVFQIKGLTQTYGSLTIEERNLLSVAYKNITNNLRSSWRVVDSLEKLESSRVGEAGHSKHQVVLIRRQRSRIERELADVCKDIVRLLDDCLLTTAEPGEETVFYYKMKGDYYRYLAEFAQQHDRSRFSDLSLGAYKISYKHALAMLDPTHPTRLGLALNFAVYYHDVRKSPERACHLGKHAFDEAVARLDESSSQIMRDSMMILQLLRDDLVIWSGEMHKDGKQ
ncbi:14-3-3 domain-containing protein [Hygrophoropsis aurantiaca]|uniref:14-3-3 domain-containing protein n=1 Tax=Hygrophoropsis aurantiaca TaxID=72124 RepID=A0ACB8ARS1_9AGAM|nr:14-3-3 domain-containing protein [Hygrophoropsis aurantiaca]